MKPVIDYTLYLVLDPILCGSSDPLDVAERAIAGGATLIQWRASEWSKRDRFFLAARLKERLAERNVPLLINNDIDVALACGADGAHIGQSDLPVVEARRLLGETAILGLSISSPEQMRAAAALPQGSLDYVGIGPTFPTTSKKNAAPVLGIEALGRIATLSPYPCVAIGGIDVQNASELSSTGIDGIAVISAICSQPDPQTAARTLRQAFTGERKAAS